MNNVICIQCGENPCNYQMNLPECGPIPLCSKKCQRENWLLLTFLNKPSLCNDHSLNKIGFQIFMPSDSFIGNALSYLCPHNMVHQRITQDAVTLWEHSFPEEIFFSGKNFLSSKRLVEGLVWNDFPTDYGNTKHPTYNLVFTSPKNLQEKMRACQKYYKTNVVVSDERFSYGPSMFQMAKLGAVLILPNQLITGTNNILAKRTHSGDLSHYHAMVGSTEEERAMSVQNKRDKIIDQLCEWFMCACKYKDMFYLGHIFHTIQDSYSSGHVWREYRKGRGSVIIKFYDFSRQESSDHLAKDSMYAYVSMNPVYKKELFNGLHFFMNQFLAGESPINGDKIRKTMKTTCFKLSSEQDDEISETRP